MQSLRTLALMILRSIPLHRLRPCCPSSGNLLLAMFLSMMMVWTQTLSANQRLGTNTASSAFTKMTYQGRLSDANQKPINGPTNMEFRLYNTATGGVPLWQEYWTGANSVQVRNGLFTVMLGNITAIPSTVITDSNGIWLGITVGTGAELTPRVQITAVPWAVQAMTVPDTSISPAKLDRAYVPVTGGTISGNLQIQGASTFGTSGIGEGGEIWLAPGSSGGGWTIDNYFGALRGITNGAVRFSVDANGNMAASGSIDAPNLRAFPKVLTANDTKIQHGNTAFNTSVCDGIRVTFAQPFSATPNVIITQREGTAGYGQYMTSNVTSSGFSVSKHANCTTHGSVDWIAIGR